MVACQICKCRNSMHAMTACKGTSTILMSDMQVQKQYAYNDSMQKEVCHSHVR